MLKFNELIILIYLSTLLTQGGGAYASSPGQTIVANEWTFTCDYQRESNLLTSKPFSVAACNDTPLQLHSHPDINHQILVVNENNYACFVKACHTVTKADPLQTVWIFARRNVRWWQFKKERAVVISQHNFDDFLANSLATAQTPSTSHPPLGENDGRTVIFYFHGTGSQPENASSLIMNPTFAGGELITSLGAITTGEEGQDFHRIAGPGARSINIAQRFTRYSKDYAYSILRGRITGAGRDDIIEDAMDRLLLRTTNHLFISRVTKQRRQVYEGTLKPVTKIVLVGWSRGAVEAIAFANRLWRNKELAHIPVYLFAVDPVPGLGHMSLGTWRGIRSLHANVREAVILLAQHERSIGFNILLPRTKDNLAYRQLYHYEPTQVHLLDYPGNHGTLAGNINRTKKIKNAPLRSALLVSLLVRDLAEKFIVRHTQHLKGDAGPHLMTTMALSNAERLQYYDEINLKDFSHMTKESYTYFCQLLQKSRKIQVGHDRLRVGLDTLLPFHAFKASQPTAVNWEHARYLDLRAAGLHHELAASDALQSPFPYFLMHKSS